MARRSSCQSPLASCAVASVRGSSCRRRGPRWSIQTVTMAPCISIGSSRTCEGSRSFRTVAARRAVVATTLAGDPLTRRILSERAFPLELLTCRTPRVQGAGHHVTGAQTLSAISARGALLAVALLRGVLRGR